jgi:integrase
MRAVHTFSAWMREEHYSDRTREKYLGLVTRARITLGPLDRASAEQVRAWWATFPPSAASRNGVRNALVAYYRSKGGVNPAVKLPRIPEGDPLPRPVAFEVYETLFDAARDLGGKYEMLYMLLAWTGCRISEATVARRAQFDLGAGTWRIVGKGSRRKGPKERIVPLHGDLAAQVRVWPEPDWLFPSRGGTGPADRSTTAKWMRELVEHGGVAATAHQIRHTVATLGLERSRDVRAVQELLGHASLATTQRYTFVTAERTRSLVALLGPAAA